MLKNFTKLVKQTLYPGDIENAIEKASLMIENFAKISDGLFENTVSPVAAKLIIETEGSNHSDIINYLNGENTLSEESINLISSLSINKEEEQKEIEKNLALLKRHPDRDIEKNRFYEPDTPIYTLYQTWKEELNNSDFLEGIEHSLGNFQSMLNAKLYELNAYLDADGTFGFKAPTKSDEDLQRLKNAKKEFESMLDLLPTIRKDFGLSEQPSTDFPSNDDLIYELQQDLTAE